MATAILQRLVGFLSAALKIGGCHRRVLPLRLQRRLRGGRWLTFALLRRLFLAAVLAQGRLIDALEEVYQADVHILQQALNRAALPTFQPREAAELIFVHIDIASVSHATVVV